MEGLERVKAFIDSDGGGVLKSFIEMKLNELNSISDIREKDTPTHQAVELKAHKRAYEKLSEILAYIGTFSNSTLPAKDPRDSYGIAQ